MWQCPFHPDVHVRGGSTCQTCALEKLVKDNEARDRKEQEEKQKQTEEDAKWFNEGPGRRVDKPRWEKPGKVENQPAVPEVEDDQQEEVAAPNPELVSQPSKVKKGSHILTILIAIPSLSNPTPKPFNATYHQRHIPFSRRGQSSVLEHDWLTRLLPLDSSR